MQQSPVKGQAFDLLHESKSAVLAILQIIQALGRPASWLATSHCIIRAITYQLPGPIARSLPAPGALSLLFVTPL